MSQPYKVALFSAKAYDKTVFEPLLTQHQVQFSYFDTNLNNDTVLLARDFDCVCIFVNDQVCTEVIQQLSAFGVKHIALRCAGYNNVNIARCEELGLAVSHVPAYSPHSVAEHALALILTLNRRIHKAYNRVKEGNFDLQGLLGFTLHDKTIGVIGTGRIGQAFINILRGFGCNIVCYDPYPTEELACGQVRYTTLNALLECSDIISLHCPLTTQNQHMIDDAAIDRMKANVMLINTSRGGLIDTTALVRGLKSRKIGYVGLDVYEMEAELFFRDRSCEVIQDDLFQRLSTFHNVVITGHQGFFTIEALTEISQTTVNNILSVERGDFSSDCILVPSD